MTMKEPSPTALTLVSHHLCPYVQRAAIVLAEKGVGFEQLNIDLANKPDWFRAISPLGKVPLLLIGRDEGDEATIFESAIICEYLEETQVGATLHPADPLRRAQHRGWIEFGSSILTDIWGLETATNLTAYDKHRQMLADKLRRVEAELGTGPYFDGHRFSMVDAVYAPVFRYFDLFDTLADTGIFEGIPKVLLWRKSLVARPSVVNAVPPDYADRLHAFLVERDAYLLKIAVSA